MNFLVQFIRFRRGVPEAVRTLPFAAVDAASALSRAQELIGIGSYPVRTEALRVMDDGGRTLIDWTERVMAEQPAAYVPEPVSNVHQAAEPALLALPEAQPQNARTSALMTGRHQFAIGQPVSYTEDGKPHISRGGFEIVGLCEPGTHEPNYAIRSADESSDRLVQEHELQEDLCARVRGR